MFRQIRSTSWVIRMLINCLLEGLSHYFNTHLLYFAKQVMFADILDSDVKFKQDLQSFCPKSFLTGSV